MSAGDLQRRNRRLLLATLSVALGMIALSFASVPLYRAICQVTGWGGKTRVAEKNTSPVYAREITVRFNADTDPRLPWNFRPELRQVKVRVGADALISYQAENKSARPVAGTAVYNVTPLKAGKYFNKTQCFCFSEQILQPGQKVHMPVSFFIDPGIMDDPHMNDVHTITLSYTFYRHSSPELEKAIEKFTMASDNPPKKIN